MIIIPWHKGFKHTPPQDLYRDLTQDITRNYKLTVDFYSKRRRALQDFLNKKINDSKASANKKTAMGIQVKNLDKVFTEVIKNSWRKDLLASALHAYLLNDSGKTFNMSDTALKEMVKEINCDYKAAIAAGNDPFIKKKTEMYNARSFIYKALKEVRKTAAVDKDGNVDYENVLRYKVFLNMGIIYEGKTKKFITSFVSNNTNTAKGMLMNFVNESFTGTGKKKSKSAARGNDSMVGFDYVIGDFDKKKKDGYLVSKEGITSEMSIEVDDNLDEVLTSMQNQQNMRDQWEQFERTVRGFLNSSVFGFQVKNYDFNDSHGREYMKSSKYAADINNIFNNGVTWEPAYASLYSIYMLSKHLISIITPVNVAIITSKRMIWMDEFVANHLFYMNVMGRHTEKMKNYTTYVDGEARLGRPHEQEPEIRKYVAGGGEVKPFIADTAIYARLFNTQANALFMNIEKKIQSVTKVRSAEEKYFNNNLTKWFELDKNRNITPVGKLGGGRQNVIRIGNFLKSQKIQKKI